jgi:hypothetical protein
MSLADFYKKATPSIEAMNAAAGAGQKQAPVPPPKASINYKDAPPSIQRQMEKAEGYEPAKEMAGTVHMDHLKTDKVNVQRPTSNIERPTAEKSGS